MSNPMLEPARHADESFKAYKERQKKMARAQKICRWVRLIWNSGVHGTYVAAKHGPLVMGVVSRGRRIAI